MSLLVIRGDLQSHSGHAAASRDYCRLLQTLFDQVVGVDLHYCKDLPFEPFPCPIVTEAEARRLASQADFALVLTFTTPDYYVRYRNAATVGMTVWETDRLPPQDPHRLGWIERINRMDGLWVHSTHSQQLFAKASVTVPIRVIPWPTSAPTNIPTRLPDGRILDLNRRPIFARSLARIGRFEGKRFASTKWLMKHVGGQAARCFLQGLSVSAQSLPDPAGSTLLAVAQDVPRKGLLYLLAEWMEFKRRPEAEPWSLLLRSSPCKEVKHFDFIFRFWAQVQALKKQMQVERAKVYLWSDGLTDLEFEQLLANTAGCICPSLGEGFCGPAARALTLGKPLLAPRHTSFTDFLPADYPYLLSSRPAHLRFLATPAAALYHPASVWQVPEAFTLASALSRLSADSPERRQEVAHQAQAACQAFCSPARVRHLLSQELARLAERNLVHT